MHRQIILDTETTGISVDEGHRIIEIGCIEMMDRKLTGNHFHQYINPDREVEAGALAVHGISNEFLSDKPFFKDVADQFMDFVSGAELIIHNAPFDVSFINLELRLMESKWKKINDQCRIIDTLLMARKLHAGQRNSLDALCKRYSVDHSKRELHGALLDAHLLAQVYLAMTGGQGSFFDALVEQENFSVRNNQTESSATFIHHEVTLLKATDEELAEHEAYLRMMEQTGKCLWLEKG